MSTISLKWVEDHLFVASDSHDHSFVIGKHTGSEGVWLGVKPSDLLLVAAASCSSWDVVEILEKQRQPLKDLKVTCSGEQMSEAPYQFTKIHLHFTAVGAIHPEKLEKAIYLSVRKYCSVISSLRPDLSVTHDFEIINDQAR